MNEREILNELTPVAETLLERHLAASKEWFPHEYVPYGRGRDHVPGHEWSEGDADLGGAQLTPEVRSALHSVLAPHATPEGVRMESASWMVRARI